MQTINGIVRDGQIAFSEPIVWPEGTQVSVRPIRADSSNQDQAQVRQIEADDCLGNDKESIARWLIEFDAIPALQMTPGEEAEWQAARRVQKAFDAAHLDDSIWNTKE